MSVYDQITDRDSIEGVVTEDVSSEIIQSAVEASAALSLFPRVRMSQKVRRLPVLSALPTAYWVDGEADGDDSSAGLKQTSNMAWDKKYLTAEELAVIVPIHENVLADSTFDIFGELRPRIGEAIGKALDSAIFAGLSLPASWSTNGTDGIIPDAVAAGNVLDKSAAATTAAAGGLAQDMNTLFGQVEADGFDVDFVAAERTFRALLRGARDTTGQRYGDLNPNGGTVEGADLKFVPSGTLNGNLAVVGNRRQAILGLRQDISYKVLTEAVIQDNHGAIVYNLAQQDMVALRVTFRAAFQVANPKTSANQNDGTRYPFAVYVP
jgi:HK97 family phage major capsid protein